MKALRELVIASLAVAVLATGAADAASGTDLSDESCVAVASGRGESVP